MASSGPIPKRSDERVRRNKPDIEIEKLDIAGPVPVPELSAEYAHPITRSFYQSLSESAQKKYYEPSDWQSALLAMHFLDQLLNSPRPSAQLLHEVNVMLTDLLVTEGSRRRVRLEVERNTAQAEVIDLAETFRQRFAQG